MAWRRAHGESCARRRAASCSGQLRTMQSQPVQGSSGGATAPGARGWASHQNSSACLCTMGRSQASLLGQQAFLSETTSRLDHVRVLTGEWPPRGPKTRFCSRACPPHRGRSAWWPRTSAAVSDVARLHVGLSSMKATEREVAELSAGISAAGREEVLLERDKITKDALSAGRRRPTGRQLLSRCTPLTHRSRSSIAHRV